MLLLVFWHAPGDRGHDRSVVVVGHACFDGKVVKDRWKSGRGVSP